MSEPSEPSEPRAPRGVKLVSFCGSLREGSYTAMALRPVIEAAVAEGAEVIDFPLGQLPLCDGRDDGWPEPVERLRELVAAADGLIIGTPEYHNSCSGVVKNALDLLSAEHLGDKVCGLISVAGGASAMSSLSHLRIILRAVHAWPVPQQVMIAEAWKHFEADGRIGNPKLDERCRDLGRRVVLAARKLRS